MDRDGLMVLREHKKEMSRLLDMVSRILAELAEELKKYNDKHLKEKP